LPVYLQEENYTAIRQNAHRVQVHHANFTELLAQKPAQSVDRFVLLDAQDWMTGSQLNALWTEITRTATQDARVIFRTAAIKSILDGRLDAGLLDQWDYKAEESVRLGKLDRSAIYGGFHIYEKKR
jgi:S-adenosylmethionine-diacylglycerol 3-amino-3-carboxypropyl transferase